jgi:hypothetical protein
MIKEKRMKKSRFAVVIIITLIFVLPGVWLIASLSTPAEAQDRVSAPGQYSGYSPVLYDGYQLTSQYVPVRDGTKLAVDVIRPTLNGEVVTTPLPVVWMHTPYNRRYYGGRLAAELYPGAAMGLVKYGYVVATVDQRGIYASYGTSYSGDSWDAYDITEWLAAQPWSDGKIGMWGCSATGGSQVAAANLMPPHLKAVFPMSCGFSSLRGESLPGATPRYPSAADTPGSIPAADANAVAVDEDTDKSMLAAAKEEHRYNYLGKLNVPISLDQVEASTIAMYNAANWVDIMPFPRDTFFRFNNLNNPGRVLLGPGAHCIWNTEYSPKAAPLDFNIVREEHRWFDYWLKGIINGVMDEPQIYYYTYNADAGKAWRYAWQWPLPTERRVNYYLGAGPSGLGYGVNDGTLSTTAPSTAGAKDVYTTDYSIQTVSQTDAYGLRWITQPEASTKGLTYTTAPLTADMVLTGHPVVHLWISSTATDGDFIADLEDIAPDGTASSLISASGSPSFGIIAAGRPLPDGINGIRASFRTLSTPPFNNGGLPWRRNAAEDIKPLTPGEPAELVFDLRPLSHIVKAGHRIRLTITAVCGDATPQLSPAPVVTFYRDPTRSSYITLPVIMPITATARIVPGESTLAAHMTFPSTMDSRYLQDITPGSITCNGVAAVSKRMDGDTLIAVFSRSNLREGATMAIQGEFGNRYSYGDMTFTGTGTVPSSSGGSGCFIDTAGFGSRTGKIFGPYVLIITDFFSFNKPVRK